MTSAQTLPSSPGFTTPLSSRHAKYASLLSQHRCLSCLRAGSGASEELEPAQPNHPMADELRVLVDESKDQVPANALAPVRRRRRPARAHGAKQRPNNLRWPTTWGALHRARRRESHRAVAFHRRECESLCVVCVHLTPHSSLLPMASLQATTPVHQHPLSVDEGSRSRRGRGTQPTDSHVRSPTNYFTLKARLDSSAEEQTKDTRANWDGSVRGYGKEGKRRFVAAPYNSSVISWSCT